MNVDCRYPCELHLSRREVQGAVEIIANGPILSHLNANNQVQVTLSTRNGDEQSFQCVECGLRVRTSVTTTGVVTIVHLLRGT